MTYKLKIILFFLFAPKILFSQLDSAWLEEFYNTHYLGLKIPDEYHLAFQMSTGKLSMNPDSVLYISHVTVKPKSIEDSLGSNGGGLLYSEFMKCKNLGFISVDLNKEIPFTLDFTNFPHLRQISIYSGAPTEKQLYDIFTTAKELRGIDIHYNGKIPDCICELKHLRYLKFYNGHNLIFPPCLSSMKSLKYLSFTAADSAKNSIVWNIPSLEGINVENGDFSYIPSTIKNMKSLKSIAIYGVNSINFPPEIGELDSLELLDIGKVEEKITFPNEFGNLQNLRGIRIVNVSLKNFPILTKSKNLLTLSYDGISSVDTNNLDFTGLTKIRNITLGGAAFSRETSFPKGLETVDSLTFLDLYSWSRINRIPPYFSKFKEFKYFNIQGKNIPFEDKKMIYSIPYFREFGMGLCCHHEHEELHKLYPNVKPVYADAFDGLLTPFEYYKWLNTSNLKIPRRY